MIECLKMYRIAKKIQKVYRGNYEKLWSGIYSRKSLPEMKIKGDTLTPLLLFIYNDAIIKLF